MMMIWKKMALDDWSMQRNVGDFLLSIVEYSMATEVIKTCMPVQEIFMAEIRKNSFEFQLPKTLYLFPVRKLGKPILNLNRTLIHMFMLVIIMHVKIKDIHPKRKLQSSKNCF